MDVIQKTRAASKLLTPQQAGDYLGGIPPATLQAWRTHQRYPLPYVRIGRLIRYKVEDLQAFVESRTISSEAAR